MVRPTEYDLEEVMTNATREFWLRGYEGTSMANLLEATGLTSRSLYNKFGSKEGLFEECLNRYYTEGMEQLLNTLKSKEGSKSIRNFFMAITQETPVNGCLLGNTLSDRNLVSEKSQAVVKKYLSKMEKIFEEKLRYARKKEGFRGDPKIRSRQMVTFVIGLGQISKSGMSAKDLREQANDYLEMNKL